MLDALVPIGEYYPSPGAFVEYIYSYFAVVDLPDSAAGQFGLADEAEEGSFTFANFVEFDTNFGHRRDVAGYARQLEWFDGRAGAFLARLRPGDLAIFTADHGNDPTWRGTEHTRERVPVLCAGAGAGSIGLVGFSDVAASVAASP